MSTPQITKFNLTSGWFSSKYPNHLGKSRKIPNHQIIWLEYHSFWAQWPSRVPGRLPGVSLQGLGAWGYGKNQEITSKTWISIRAIHDSCLKCFPKFPSSSIFASKHAALVTWLTTQAAPPLFHGRHLVQPALALIEVRQGRSRPEPQALGKVAQTQLFLGAICAGGDHAPPTRALHQVTPGDQLIPAACEIPMGFSFFESQLMLLKSLAAICSPFMLKKLTKKIDPFPIVSIHTGLSCVQPYSHYLDESYHWNTYCINYDNYRIIPI